MIFRTQMYWLLDLCYNIIMKRNRIIFILSTIGLAALIILLRNTSPTDIGPFGVLLFFTTLYLTLFGVATLGMMLFLRFAFGRTKMRSKDYLSTAILAFGPIMVLMARSFGAINLWTISLIVVFLALAEFLVMKRA